MAKKIPTRVKVVMSGVISGAIAGLVVALLVDHRPFDIWNWNWTAIGTLVLAVVTLGSVLLGWRALRDTRSEIDVSRAALEVSQKEMEAAQRPVLLPTVNDAVHFSIHEWGSNVPARPQLGGAGNGQQLLIPIRNVGTGLALNVTVLMIGRDDAFGWSEMWGDQAHAGYLIGVATDEPAPAMITPPAIGGVPCFELAIVYRDLADTGWITFAKYQRGGEDGGRGMYIQPRIQRAPDASSSSDLFALALKGMQAYRPTPAATDAEGPIELPDDLLGLDDGAILG